MITIKIILIILAIILTPVIIYVLSKIQMLGWIHGMRDFINQINNKEKDEQTSK